MHLALAATENGVGGKKQNSIARIMIIFAMSLFQPLYYNKM
jgi:hypothetical protein